MIIGLIVTASLCLGWAIPKNYEAVTPDMISYETQEGSFVLVLVETDDLSVAEEKHLIRKKAAQVAFDHGYRYIVIEEEGETVVAASKKPWPSNQGFHRNMYQELIIEHDSGKESMQRNQTYGTETKKGYRIVFKAYEDSPGWNAIDVCTLIPCY